MITIFRNVRDVSTPFYLELEKVVERLKSPDTTACLFDSNGSYSDISKSELLSRIHNSDDKKEKQNLKAGLPSILFSGDFPNRKRDALPRNHSGLIILDIDELGDYSMGKLGDILRKDKHTLLSFISPSGNGYKCLVKIPADTKRHVGYYLALEKYYFSEYKIKLDPTGKNIGRVCYESFDPDLYFNPDSEIFKSFIEPIANTSKVGVSKLDVLAIKSDDEIIEKVTTWWVKKYDFNSGRNASIYHLASALNRYGVSEFAALNHCIKFEDYSREKDPFTANEIERVVKNVYSQQIGKHGSEVMQSMTLRKSVIDEIMGSDPSMAVENLSHNEAFENLSPTELEEVVSEVKQEHERSEKKANIESRAFWYYDDGKLKIDVKQLITFINELGYYTYYPTDTPNAYYFIKIENNIIKPVDERNIKIAVLDFVTSKDQNVVYNLISERTKYWTRTFLNALPAIDPPILRDKKDTSYIPTPSCVYKITKKDIIKIDYLDLTEGYVWESQITKRDFSMVENGGIEGDFYKFVNHIGGDGADKLHTIIGYLLHNYKDPAESKAVFIYDKNLSQVDGEPEGGSGKSLILEAIKFLREVATMSGDRVDFKRSFVFQEVSESTQIAWIDELDQKADIKKFFSRITNGLPVEKKNMAPIFIENEDSPKFAFTTNFKPKGSSDSHSRRRIDFAVTNYFSVDRTPKMIFKKSFFKEWNKDEWDSFFTFYLNCLKKYLSKGIIKNDDKDDLYLTILAECGSEMTDFWINDGNLNNIISDGFFNARNYYKRLLHTYDITSNDLSIKKYLQGIRKILKLHHINIKEEGRRADLTFKIIN